VDGVVTWVGNGAVVCWWVLLSNGSGQKVPASLQVVRLEGKDGSYLLQSGLVFPRFVVGVLRGFVGLHLLFSFLHSALDT
jgi:hypothetical protein